VHQGSVQSWQREIVIVSTGVAFSCCDTVRLELGFLIKISKITKIHQSVRQQHALSPGDRFASRSRSQSLERCRQDKNGEPQA
jgi:hypothetical protein